METKKQKTGDQGTDDPRISIILLFFYLDRYLLILLFLIYDTRAFGTNLEGELAKGGENEGKQQGKQHPLAKKQSGIKKLTSKPKQEGIICWVDFTSLFNGGSEVRTKQKANRCNKRSSPLLTYLLHTFNDVQLLRLLDGLNYGMI